MHMRMEIYPRAAVERAMKLQEVLLRATAGKIKWWQEAGAAGSGRAGCQLVSRTVLRSERAALSREARRGTSDRVELHVGQAGAASSQPGEAEVEAGNTPQAS